MKLVPRMIFEAVLFAAALLASSWLLKGKPAGDWVDAALYIGLASFLLSQAIIAMKSPKSG